MDITIENEYELIKMLDRAMVRLHLDRGIGQNDDPMVMDVIFFGMSIGLIQIYLDGSCGFTSKGESIAKDAYDNNVVNQIMAEESNMGRTCDCKPPKGQSAGRRS